MFVNGLSDHDDCWTCWIAVLNWPLSSSLQFNMAAICSKKPFCAPPCLSGVSPTSPFKAFPMFVWLTMSFICQLRKIIERFLFLITMMMMTMMMMSTFIAHESINSNYRCAAPLSSCRCCMCEQFKLMYVWPVHADVCVNNSRWCVCEQFTLMYIKWTIHADVCVNNSRWCMCEQFTLMYVWIIHADVCVNNWRWCMCE